MNWATQIIMEELKREEEKKEREEEKREGEKKKGERRERRERKEEEEKKREGEVVVQANVKYLEGSAVFVGLELRSKSREGLTHKTRLVIRGSEILARSCTCEGWEYRKRCWHMTYTIEWAKAHGFMS